MRTWPFLFGFLILLTTAVTFAEPNRTTHGEVQKQQVLGIGGFFFRAQNPKALAKWYLENLGINLVPENYDQLPWVQNAGPTAFAPFPIDSDYFGDAKKNWVLNFRVQNLDAMAAQLRAAGIAVKIDPQHYPNGRFARLHDPEGNPIELWQAKIPVTRDASPTGTSAQKSGAGSRSK